jgi:hypothetical protein
MRCTASNEVPTSQKRGQVSDESIKALMDRFAGDPEFQREFRAHPRGAAERYGYALTDDEAESLGSLELDGSDEELIQRVSKVVPIRAMR